MGKRKSEKKKSNGGNIDQLLDTNKDNSLTSIYQTTAPDMKEVKVVPKFHKKLRLSTDHRDSSRNEKSNRSEDYNQQPLTGTEGLVEKNVSQQPVTGTEGLEEKSVSQQPVTGTEGLVEKNVSHQLHTGTEDLEEKNVGQQPHTGTEDLEEKNVSHQLHTGTEDLEEKNVGQQPHTGTEDLEEKNVGQQPHTGTEGLEEKNVGQQPHTGTEDLEEKNVGQKPLSGTKGLEEKNENKQLPVPTGNEGLEEKNVSQQPLNGTESIEEKNDIKQPPAGNDSQQPPTFTEDLEEKNDIEQPLTFTAGLEETKSNKHIDQKNKCETVMHSLAEKVYKVNATDQDVNLNSEETRTNRYEKNTKTLAGRNETKDGEWRGEKRETTQTTGKTSGRGDAECRGEKSEATKTTGETSGRGDAECRGEKSEATKTTGETSGRGDANKKMKVNIEMEENETDELHSKTKSLTERCFLEDEVKNEQREATMAVAENAINGDICRGITDWLDNGNEGKTKENSKTESAINEIGSVQLRTDATVDRELQVSEKGTETENEGAHTMARKQIVLNGYSNDVELFSSEYHKNKQNCKGDIINGTNTMGCGLKHHEKQRTNIDVSKARNFGMPRENQNMLEDGRDVEKTIDVMKEDFKDGDKVKEKDVSVRNNISTIFQGDPIDISPVTSENQAPVGINTSLSEKSTSDASMICNSDTDLSQSTSRTLVNSRAGVRASVKTDNIEKDTITVLQDIAGDVLPLSVKIASIQENASAVCLESYGQVTMITDKAPKYLENNNAVCLMNSDDVSKVKSKATLPLERIFSICSSRSGDTKQSDTNKDNTMIIETASTICPGSSGDVHVQPFIAEPVVVTGHCGQGDNQDFQFDQPFKEEDVDDDDMTDSQLCAVDDTEELIQSFSPHPVVPRSKPQMMDGTNIVSGLINELSNLNRSILRMKREIENARRQQTFGPKN